MITGECDGLVDIYFPADTIEVPISITGLMIIGVTVTATITVDNRFVDTCGIRFYGQRLYIIYVKASLLVR